MSIIVGGGSGFIGRAFTRMGKNKGYKIINVSRKARPNQMTWQDVASSGLPKDCAAVISMSGEPILQPFRSWTDKMKNDIRSSRIEKTQILANAIQSAIKPPKAFLSFSGIAYYKPDLCTTYTEDSHVQPYDFLSRLQKDWELAAKLPEGAKTRVVILRTGVVVGNGGGIIENLWLPFFLGGGGPLGTGNQWMSWIHVDDMAGVMWHAIEKESVKGVINCTAPNPVVSKEFSKSLATAMNRPHMVPFPEFAANMMFGPEGAKVILEGQKVLPKVTVKSGYKFRFPDIDSACKQVVSTRGS